MNLLPLVLLFASVTSAQAQAAGTPPQQLPRVVEINVPADTARGWRPRQPAGQALPLEPTRSIAFETDEGTWMSLDRSPADGRITFDLLGDIYTLDPAGGRAQAVVRGMGMDTQPVFSPDGEWIAFVSDRSGAENLWIVRPDGSDPRQVSFGADDTVLTSPTWSPDGDSLYVSRFLWSRNDFELWHYGLDGSETLVTPAKTEAGGRQSSLGAVVSPDGRFMYFARRTGGEDNAGVDLWSIVRRDLADGSERTLLPEPGVPGRRPYPGTYFRPALSPDGRLLAYATRFAGQTGLRLRNLDTGDDRWLAFPIEADQINAQGWQDLVPRYAFSADGQAVLLSRHGRIERVPLDGGQPTPIPFVAAVELELGPLNRQDIREDTGPVRARLIQAPMPSPDGTRLAFSALGGLYLMPLDGSGQLRRLDTGGTPAFHPAWSPDGRQLAYVTWTAREGGQVWLAPLDGGSPRRLSNRAAFYTYPAFAPDGDSVWVVASGHRARNQAVVNYGQLREADLLALPVDGGEARVLHHDTIGGRVHPGPGGRVQVRSERGLIGVDPTTGETTDPIVVKGPGWYFQDGSTPVDDLRLSPDGRWLLALVAQQLHLLETPPAGTVVDLSEPGLRHRRITDVGADFFEWADGGDSIVWAVGSTFHRRPLASIALNPADSPGWDADPSIADYTETFQAVVELPRDTPAGSMLLRGARAITLRGDEVIERADVLVRDGRIAAIGARGSIDAPAGTTVLDVTGKTIVPGFIDMHDHVSDIRRDVLQMDSWGLASRLAYGVTTAFDPSTLSIDLLAYQDLVDAGLVTGARAPSTGMAMFSYNRLASLDDARALLRRYRDHYRIRNVKQYLIGNRTQRQWLAMAATELGMMPTTEGSLTFKLAVGMIQDGYAAIEHALPTALYRDMVELMVRSGTANNGVLQNQHGGPAAQDKLIARNRPLHDPRFLRHRPHAVAMQAGMAGTWIDRSLMRYPRYAADAARIQRAGGVIGMGAHGNVSGIGFHWELEAHVEGGLTPLEALRAASLGSAAGIGRDAEFGSLEPGKFADLVILDANPLDDIRNASQVDRVMRNGRLYDAATLDELWPDQVPGPRTWDWDDRPPGTPGATAVEASP